VRGSVTALVTPFRAGQVDEPALAALAEQQMRRGSAGLVACGSTDEAAALSAAEQARVVAVVCEAAGALPVLASRTDVSTETAAALASLRLCADGVRLPLTRAVPATRERLIGVLARVMPAEDSAVRARHVEAVP
jgi:4-hydroxy-tetrahydrodipicolinate synthase